MKTLLYTLPPLMLIFLAAFSVTQDDMTAKEIVRKADENAQGINSSYSEMTITIVRPKWEREMSLKSWSKGNDFSMIYILTPVKDKGTIFLKRKKEVWNWLPTIGRSIKLPPSMMMQSWMGTDMTNDDIVREASVIEDYDHTLVGEEKIENRECYKIEMIPKEDAVVVWSKVIVYIDKTDFIQMRSEMYDEEGFLVNTLLASDIKNMDDHLIATKLEVIPSDKEGNKTLMTINTIEFDIEIADDFFTVANMKALK
ncbi:MAG: outer membrane lipoprotein-sorting protein [Chitinophagales bacterium]|nr:outer membrane lipoprotein-sorting protein [Chitinophagales bacterium]